MSEIELRSFIYYKISRRNSKANKDPRLVVLNLFVYHDRLSNCLIFQGALTKTKLHKKMYLVVNLLIKLSMLQSASRPLGRSAALD